ncbi:sensor domain-containing protein [Brevibacterium sediminis]|uniref:sensor histidine kinase n=1 Tax=Brevibacterium sediminis TaxID=1857024 RepID=UPI002175146B|nr:sensor histidine kinase [Brevibacterium sediminis]MCS4591625.1 sensor domain-containing protein [Brevibacterium sediminis]
MKSRTAWQAIAQRPLGFIVTMWPWRAVAYLVSGVLAGALTAVVLALLITAGVLTLIVVIGIALLALVPLLGVPVATLERWRLRLIDFDPVPGGHVRPERPGPLSWFRTRTHEPLTWRELGFAALSLFALWWLDLLVLFYAIAWPIICIRSAALDPTVWPWGLFGAALIPTAPFTITVWAAAHGAIARAVLVPPDAELGRELTKVRQSRERLVAAFDSERSRIERDLHDGPQQRLASLRLMLGMMELDVQPGSPLADQLDQAKGEVSAALVDLRDLARGVRPQVLTDHGLARALVDIGSRFALPVDVQAQIPRLSEHVELTAYYVTTELLSNVAKHAEATQVGVHAAVHNDLLTVSVVDDGVGGADARHGDGLMGLADRLAVVGGRLRVSSPQGGPTRAYVEIPCRIS